MSRRTALAVDDRAYTELFAPEKTLKPESWEEAEKALARDFVYMRTPIQMEQLFVDAEMKVRCGEHRYRVTEKAMADLCAQVEPPLPPGLARSWPHDVAAYVLEHLAKVPQKVVIPCVRDDTIVSFIDPTRYRHNGSKGPAQYRPIPLSTVLDVSKSLWKEGQKLAIAISDSGLVVSVVAAELKVEPKKGDVTEVGVRLTGSETGGPQPVAQGYTLRLVCSNGASLTDAFGLARFSSDPRVKEQTRLERWSREVAELVPAMDLEVLGAAYARMAEEKMLDQDWRDLYRNVTNVSTQAVAQLTSHAARPHARSAVRRAPGGPRGEAGPPLPAAGAGGGAAPGPSVILA
jgi:hypothetical protein